MSFLTNLFRPKEVRDVLYAVDNLKSHDLASNLQFGFVLAEARRAVVENAGTVKRQIIVEGQQPMHVALNLIVNICARDVRSGTEHIYRGVLSMTGNAKRALFTQAQSLMVDRGFIDQADADHGRSLLAEQIAQAG